jgi:hypothetical protein
MLMRQLVSVMPYPSRTGRRNNSNREMGRSSQHCELPALRCQVTDSEIGPQPRLQPGSRARHAEQTSAAVGRHAAQHMRTRGAEADAQEVKDVGGDG